MIGKLNPRLFATENRASVHQMMKGPGNARGHIGIVAVTHTVIHQKMIKVITILGQKEERKVHREKRAAAVEEEIIQNIVSTEAGTEKEHAESNREKWKCRD